MKVATKLKSDLVILLCVAGQLTTQGQQADHQSQFEIVRANTFLSIESHYHICKMKHHQMSHEEARGQVPTDFVFLVTQHHHLGVCPVY